MHPSAAVRQLYDLVNAGDIDAFARQIADNFVEHEELPGLPPTRAGVVDYFRMLRAAFPDMRMTVDDVLCDGDRAVARVRVTGTHSGPFAGLPATGKRIEMKLIDITRFDAEGRATEHWGIADELSMMRQLGVIPAA
jgi:steroid delta-isomerase-like uncharacterized protein